MNIDTLWNNEKSIKAATGLEKNEAENYLQILSSVIAP